MRYSRATRLAWESSNPLTHPCASGRWNCVGRYRGSASDGGGGGGGGVSRENFVRMVQELKILAPPPVTEAVPTPRTDFEAGRYFERCVGELHESRSRWPSLTAPVQVRHESLEPH